jgi:hypothetical protein
MALLTREVVLDLVPAGAEAFAALVAGRRAAPVCCE